MVEQRSADVLEVGDCGMGEDELRLGVVLDESPQVIGDRRQTAAGVDQDRHAPLCGQPEHRVEPALAEVELLRPGVQLDAARAPVEAALGLGDRLRGEVEPAERDERPVGCPRPFEDAVVGHPVGREAVRVVQRKCERALDAVGRHGGEQLLGRLGEAVLVHAHMRVRVPDPDVVGERGADALEVLVEDPFEPRRGHGRTLSAAG